MNISFMSAILLGFQQYNKISSVLSGMSSTVFTPFSFYTQVNLEN